MQYQLESILLKKFINSFKLFENLSSSIIRIVKNLSSEGKSEIILRKDLEINNIYLVTNGSIKIFDD